MSEDWRLRVDLHEPAHALELTTNMEATELEHDLKTAFENAVAVSRDGPEVFCYAETREQAESALDLIKSLAERNGWKVDAELRRWHPVAEEWVDPDAPLPDTDAARAAEHGEMIQAEREESESRGYPEFEVRMQCASHHDAKALAERLKSEGYEPVQRWKYLLIGAGDEDSAQALAAQLREEAPPGCTVTAEGSLRTVYDERPPNPFAIFGGLAG
jgi:hypothetical protein